MSDKDNDDNYTIKEEIDEGRVEHKPAAFSRGSSGTLHMGILCTDDKSGETKEVAVKKIVKKDKEDNKQFKKEISFYEKLKHPNIVHYYGTVITEACFLIVMEYANNGDLFKYLKGIRDKGKQLDREKKLEWEMGAARCIQFLHGKGITHGDIKSPNFLIASDNTIKLCDFGTTKATVSTLTTKTQSTPQWQAPEMFEEGHFSSKVDIFALGVVLWELETCQEPYKGYKPKKIEKKVEKGGRPNIHDVIQERAKRLISNCWKQNSDERPDIDLVVRELMIYKAEVSKVSERDIQFIITTLGPNHLKELYIELEISAATVSRREVSAQGDDVDAKAREVLQGWVTNNGSKATRGAVLEAMHRAKLRDAEDKCRDKWDLPDLPPTTQTLDVSSDSRQQAKENVSTVPGKDDKPLPRDSLHQPHKSADTSKSTLQQPQRSTDTGKKPPSEKRQHQSTSKSEDSSQTQTFKKRDRVRIKDLETKEMKRLQDGHGGYNKLMGMSRNQTGKVVREHFTGDVHVRLDSGISWTYNPECLTWISDGSGDSTEEGREINGIRKGSRVKIRNMEIDEMKRLQKLHGGYNPRMSLVRNGLGKVQKIDSDGDIVVKTDDGPKFAFNPECVELVEDEAEHEWQDGLYKKGSGVRIIESIELEEMKKMQKECGGWLPEMAHLRGKQGVICKVTLSRVMVKMQTGRIYAIDPNLLIPDDEARTSIQRGIRKGDQVKVKTMSVDHMMELQEGNGGWVPELQYMMNKSGRVLSVRLGRAATLKMDNGRKVCFNTECLDLVEPAPGPERNLWSDDSSEDSSDDSDEDDLIAGLAKHAAKQVFGDFAQISRNRKRSESSNTNSSGVANGQRLLQAARRGDRSIVQQILHLNPGLADVLSDDGNQTPLLLACRAGDLEMARIIVDAGASLDKGNVTQNVTPLILCAYENRLEVLRLLLEKGADINGVDDDGDTALYSAAAKGNDKCVEELMKHKYNCDVNKLNKKFISAAIVAIVKKQDNICESILRSPTFDPKLTDSQDMNCLHIAAAYGNARAIAIILEIWPDGINVPHKHGITALGIACNQNHTDCVKVLLAQDKCDKNVRFLGYTTCLHHASMRGNLDIAKLLVQYNVELDAQDNDGDTPLHLCCLMKSKAAKFFARSELSHLLTRELEEHEMKLPTPETQENIAEFLVESGASLDIHNNRGITPLDMLRGTDFYYTILDIAENRKRAKGNYTGQKSYTRQNTWQDTRQMHDSTQSTGHVLTPPTSQMYIPTPFTRDALSERDFLTFNPAAESGKIIAKIKEFNDEIEPEHKIEDIEITTINDLLQPTSGESAKPTGDQVDILLKIINDWPAEKLAPVFDVLRLILKHPCVQKHLYQSYDPKKGGEEFVTSIVNKAKESNNKAVQYMVCRVLCNSFESEDGLAVISSPHIKDHILQTVMQFNDLVQGSNPKDTSSKSLRIAVATVLHNYAVIVCLKEMEREDLINTVIDMLEKTNDPETNFRLLVALKNLLAGDDEAPRGIAISRDVAATIQRIEDQPGQAKVGKWVYEVKKILNR